MFRRIFFLSLFIFLQSNMSYAQLKAKVVSQETEVYEAADFDAPVVRTVNPNEAIIVSKKSYEGFYKAKFKDGTFGFIPDTELDIEGVGTFQPRDYVEDDLLKKNKKSKKRKKNNNNDDDESNENKSTLVGVSFSVINFHENTLGGTQVDDLTALGFKYQPLPGQFDTALAYDFNVAPKAPSYYAQLTGGQTSGAIMWGSAQISNVLGLNQQISVRYGAGPFARFSYFTVQNAKNKPDKKYTLIDFNLGLDLQGGLMLHSRYATIDLGLRYFIEKKSYGAFSISLLF